VNETLCFRRFAAAFLTSHSKRTRRISLPQYSRWRRCCHQGGFCESCSAAGSATTAPMRAKVYVDDGAVALTSKPAGVPVDAGCGAVQSWELFWLCRRGISPSGVWPVRRCCGGGSDAIVRGHGLPISGAFRFARPSSVRIEAVYHTEGLFDEAAATESPCVAPMISVAKVVSSSPSGGSSSINQMRLWAQRGRGSAPGQKPRQRRATLAACQRKVRAHVCSIQPTISDGWTAPGDRKRRKSRMLMVSNCVTPCTYMLAARRA